VSDDRKQYIGASEAAAVIPDGQGRVLHRFAGPVELWQRKRGLIGETVSTPVMQIGNLLEPLIWRESRHLLPDDTRLGPAFADPAMRSGALGAHPDAYCSEGPIDFKAVTKTREGWDRAIPLHYLVQLAAQTACMGMTSSQARIVSCHLDRGAEVRVSVVEVTAEWVSAVQARADEFWRDYVLTGVRPPDLLTAAETVPVPLPLGEGERLATEEEADLITRWRKVRANIAALKDEEDALKEALSARAADALRLLDPADPSRSAVTFNTRETVSYDRAVLEHLAPAEILDAARKVSVTRPIILTTRKKP
jgi:predicted phage-related endonuclease